MPARQRRCVARAAMALGLVAVGAERVSTEGVTQLQGPAAGAGVQHRDWQSSAAAAAAAAAGVACIGTVVARSSCRGW